MVCADLERQSTQPSRGSEMTPCNRGEGGAKCRRRYKSGVASGFTDPVRQALVERPARNPHSTDTRHPVKRKPVTQGYKAANGAVHATKDGGRNRPDAHETVIPGKADPLLPGHRWDQAARCAEGA